MRNATTNSELSLSEDDFVDAAVVPLQTYASVAQSNGLFSSQWYLSGVPFTRSLPSVADVNVDGVWAEYDGSGVRVGIIDNFFDVDHPDLAGRFDLAASYDPNDPVGASDIRPDDKYGIHGTIVASTIGASAANGMGMAGVAYGATLVGFVTRLYSTAASARPELTDLLARQVAVDVTNNSWGFTTAFSDNFRLWTWADYGAAFQQVAAEGRHGLGTVLVFAAGNDRQYVANDAAHDGDNTNYHNSTNSRFVLTVAATDETGHVTDFSTPGASVFIAAPGKNMLAARIADTDGNRANDFTYASGTSLAAPVVTGVVALMLDANPGLGYRDVQDILAHSALRIDPNAAGWTVNGAATWNGGGLLVSSDVGFGLVDAHAAVRLAETWTATQTHQNEVVIALDGTVNGSGTLTDNVPLTFGFQAQAPVAGFELQWIEVDVDITHTAVGDLRVVLISPEGTESVLVDRPGAGNNTRANLQFTLSSDQFWGEDVAGDWRLVVTDAGTKGTGNITDWNVRFFGSAGHDDVYVFTDQFAELSGERGRIVDAAGVDTINASPLTTNSTIDLTPGALSTIAGRALGIAGSALIENAVGGDGADHIVGNLAGNVLGGGRGDDVLTGRAGNDRLDGGQGSDTAEFSGALADYGFFLDGGELVVRDDRAAAPDGVDHLVSIETLHFSDATVMTADLLAHGLAAYVAAAPARPGLAVNSYTLPDSVENGVVTTSNDRFLLVGNSLDNRLTGNSGNDTLNGLAGRDILDGMSGVDTMNPGADDDMAYVDNAADVVNEFNGDGNDRILASVSFTLPGGDGGFIEKLTTANNFGTGAINLTGNNIANIIYGNAGPNIIDGLGAADTLVGLGGDDWFYVDNADDEVIERADEGTADRVLTSTNYTLGAAAHVEKLTTIDNFSTDPLVLAGNGFANTIYGNAGANSLDGRGGTDILVGLGGDDRFWVDDTGDVVIEVAGEGTDQVLASVDYTLGEGRAIEVLSTNSTPGLASINLIGNELNNTVVGNAGSNAIKGMAGNDVLFGGGGFDAFVFNTALHAKNNVDVILDFVPADDDIILSSSIFPTIAPGTLAASAFVIGTAARDADDRIIYDGATGALFYDPGGTAGGTAVQFASLAPGLALTNADFIVV